MIKEEERIIEKKKAFDLLEKSNLTIGERLFVMRTQQSEFKNEHPFMAVKFNKGKVEYFHSEIPCISHLIFETEQEVVLANAIYENTKSDFEINQFIQQLKFTFRIIGVNSKWS